MSGSMSTTTPSPVLDTKKLLKFQEKQKKTGVVYLARIPPFMRVAKVKHLLGMYGKIGRIYLVAEDSTNRTRRLKAGGNKKTNFTEGWVEYEDKNIAKAVASSLNNTPIGGKKRDYYRDDIWNIKYLSKFKWSHLTEKAAYEKRVRDQRLRVELSAARRSDSLYMENVDKAKRLEAMGERKAKKSQRDAEGSTGAAAAAAADGGAESSDRVVRKFRQHAPVASVLPGSGKKKRKASEAGGEEATGGSKKPRS